MAKKKKRRQLKEKLRSRDLKFEIREKELILMLKTMSGTQQSGVASSLAVKMEPFKFDPENSLSWIKRFEKVAGRQESSISETDKARFHIYKLDVYLYE